VADTPADGPHLAVFAACALGEDVHPLPGPQAALGSPHAHLVHAHTPLNRQRLHVNNRHSEETYVSVVHSFNRPQDGGWGGDLYPSAVR